VAYSPGTTDDHPRGCSKRLSSKAAGESKPEAYPRGYVEDFDEPRTTLADFFSILIRGATLSQEDGLNGKL
jgi:hypothetical protein